MTIGIIRIAFIFEVSQTISMMILLFWIIRNLYFLILSVFLVDGRDSDGETVIVADAEPVMLTSGDHSFEGVTTRMTEHNLTVSIIMSLVSRGSPKIICVITFAPIAFNAFTASTYSLVS